jgi:glycerophosphoryl diester phosphodiesterase
MLLLAHRGYHAEASENTMAAFEAAAKLGVDGIETDVRLSADGKPVIIHDRVSPKKRAVADLSHRELEDDLGHSVPLLAEILDAFPDVLWNIEVKSPETWPAAAQVLASYKGRRRIFVSSFRHDVVLRCADELAVDCGLLLAHRPLDVGAILAGCSGHACIKSIVWDYNIVDDAILSAVSAAGWANYVYGAVTPREHQRCKSLGVAGLITDYPALLAAERA